MTKIQSIIRQILETPYIFLADFKAGYDERFKLYIGEIVDGKVVDYDFSICYLEITNWFEQRLIDEVKYKELLSILKENISVEEFSELESVLRDLHLLRWNSSEILKGYKELPLKKKLFLWDALVSSSVVKLDIWAPVSRNTEKDAFFKPVMRYTEISNWIYVVRSDFEGKTKVLSQELGDYIGSISKDIIHYFEIGNYFKSLKRLFTLSVYVKDRCTAQTLTKLFSSPDSHLYQLLSDAKVLKEILERKELVDPSMVGNELNNLWEEFRIITGKDLPVLSPVNVYQIYSEVVLIELANYIKSADVLIQSQSLIFIKNNNLDPVAYASNLRK